MKGNGPKNQNRLRVGDHVEIGGSLGSSQPYVAIIGGLWTLGPTQARAAKTVGEQLGQELAKAKLGIVVYSSDENSLEPHVVRGYVRATSGITGMIRIRFAESQRGKVVFKEQTAFNDAFESKLFPGQDWETPFYHSIASEDGVDAVLLLGGGISTLIAGQIALARGLPVLAIDEFGGAAAKIWNQLAYGSNEVKHDSWSISRHGALVEQLGQRCTARKLARKRLARQIESLQQTELLTNRARYAAVAFSILLLFVFFGVVVTPWPFAYAFILFVGLVAAGATGGVVKLLISNAEDADSSVSLLLGSVAGFVVGVAYLIPQWIGSPGPLSPKMNAVSANDKIQFVSAILVAISAGVGFDTIFQRLKKQADTIAIGPPPRI